MKNGNVNDKENEEFLKYKNALGEYEKKVESLSKSKTTKEEKGYLVYYDDFLKLKEIINYDKKRHYYKGKKIFSLDYNNIEQIKMLEPIEIKSANYIKDIIININCVLVTKELFDLITNKYNNSILFLVDKQNLTLSLKYKEKLQVVHTNFLLNKFSFDINDPGFNDVENLYKSIENYYIYENNIINQLKNNSKNNGHGFLISKDWIDKWKSYTNYEYIKNNYFQTDFKIKENIKMIYKEIIEHKEKNKITIPETDIIIIKDKEELKSILKKKSLGFINKLFIEHCSFIKQELSNITDSSYKLTNGTLEFIFARKESIFFKCNDNIISYDNIIENEDETNEDLKQLIKIYIFQKYFLDTNNKNSKENILFKEIVLINKNKLQKYKETFEYEKLKSLLDEIIPSVPEIKKIRYKNISYEDFNNVVLDRIISELLKKNKYFIDKNKQNIPKNNKINYFNIKIINKNNKIIEYIDNFEIINNDISEYFINQKLIDKKEIIEGKLILQNNNICLVFDYNDKNFYEIGYLDENTNFIIEYIIKEYIGKKNEFRDDIINILKVKGIKNLFDLRLQDGSPIWKEKKLLGHFYFVNENKIDTNEIKNEEDSMNDDEFVKYIISFIILVHLFNNEIKENMNKKYVNKNKKHNCYLLNKTLFSQFKKIICYEEISTFFSKTIKAYGLYSSIKKIKLEKNGYYNNKILKNKSNIIEFLKKNDYKDIKYEEIKINKNKFFFPTNFEVINEKAYVCLLNILGIGSYDDELDSPYIEYPDGRKVIF